MMRFYIAWYRTITTTTLGVACGSIGLIRSGASTGAVTAVVTVWIVAMALSFTLDLLERSEG